MFLTDYLNVIRSFAAFSRLSGPVPPLGWWPNDEHIVRAQIAFFIRFSSISRQPTVSGLCRHEKRQAWSRYSRPRRMFLFSSTRTQ